MTRVDNKQSEDKTKNFTLLFLALIVGLTTGLVGAIFRIILTKIDDFRVVLFANIGSTGFSSWLLPIVLVISAIIIPMYLVRKFAPEAKGSGVHEIEGALDGLRPVRWKRVLPVKFIASLFSLGSGLLLGREGPIIQMGANIGKMIKDVFNIDSSEFENNSLISVGAGAGLVSAFNAPFAGILFVIEELHGHFKFNFYSVAALMIGAGSSTFVIRSLIGDRPIIEMTIFPIPKLMALWMFILLGLILGLVGYFYNRLLVVSLNFFENTMKLPIIVTGIISGLLIVITGVFFPEMIGGGYSTITNVLDYSYTIYFLLVLFIVRLLLSIFSYSIGVPGGIFAPLLTLGVILGMWFGIIAQNLFPDIILHAGVFAVAGMAGIFASTVRAPITGLMLAIEMTSNFELIYYL
ncbi:H(+)/Cl(-) exchange transporter ClcA [Formosa sp. PL04]|uniref:H(+)/Cl(-) exchange transporter ClcA n=1 Tax=Formosa sp. PL04 TaxID=3081755 RepID=UPI002981B240|nr:H(+)/Cl(-) exchange transporter ClcA [Formosa sp. PL04]MDW5288657.1 H(+)/Cl(-) exchange transporter ClcA [Formosa sp. PL04]